MDVILFNAILYTITLLIFLIKFKKINIVVCIWLFYSIIAWMGYAALVTEAYKYSLKNMFQPRLIPYILYYIFNIAVCLPFFFVRFEQIDIRSFSKIKSKFFNIFIGVSFFVFLIVAIIKTYEAIIVSSTYAAVDIYSSKTNFIIYSNPIIWFFSRFGSFYCSTFAPIFIIYYLSKWITSRRSKYILFALICLYPTVIGNIVSASRGGLFFSAFRLLFYYFLVQSFLKRKTKILLVTFAIIVSIGLFSYAITITTSRTGTTSLNDTGAQNNLIDYFGEPFLNLGNYIDKIQVHSHGAWTLSQIIDQYNFSLDKAPNFSIQAAWTNYFHFVTGVFKTQLGGLALDFGIYGAFIIGLCYILIWYRSVFLNYRKFYIVPLVLTYYDKVCIFGMFDFSFSVFSLYFILFILMCVYLKVAKQVN